MSTPETTEVRITSIALEAQGIKSFELQPLVAQSLPPVPAGAHIDLHLPNGMIRSYSLVNPPGERHRYVIAVSNDPASRGGSRFVHEGLRVGHTLTIGVPRNNFPLAEEAKQSVLIAGGIGVTPLWCMIQRLEELERPWMLYYCARTRQGAAFVEQLRAFGERVHFNFDQEAGGRMLDIAQVVNGTAPDTHLYCCGPTPMLNAFEKATALRPPECVHVEYFTAKEAPATSGGFTVVLARSGLSVAVPPGKTILDTLLDQGIDVPYLCMEGSCGTCETKVLEGVPDHRDVALSNIEKAANGSMMICCSGSNSEKLVLDL
jgi:ferredoxin-NADP reductase